MLLAKECGWSIKECGELTPGQIYAALFGLSRALEADDPRYGVNPRTGKETIKVDSLAEAEAYARSCAKLHDGTE